MSEAEFPDENPSDKAFGEAAAEKEEALDRAEEQGRAGELPDEGEAPRAAGKADPAGE